MLNFNTLLTLALLIPNLVYGFWPGEYELRESKITYHISFVTKRIQGVSTRAKGKAQCEQKCQAIVAVPLKSFDSGDGNRDQNVLTSTKAVQFPLVVTEFNFDYRNTRSVAINVKLAGAEKLYQVPMDLMKTDDGHIQAKGYLPIKLSDFLIARPSLMLVQIDDEVPLFFEGIWVRK